MSNKMINQRSQKGWPIFVVLAAYFFLSLVFTYPLVQKLNSHIPVYGKGGDAHSFVWNSWNFKKSLEEPPHNPLVAPTTLYPFQPNLTFHTYTLFRNACVFLLSNFFPFIASYNLVSLLMFAFSGFGAYLLALYFRCSPFSAFICGVIFSFCPFKLARLIGHYNFVDSAFIPFFILFLFMSFEKKRIFASAAAGAALAFIGYCSYYYLVFVVVFAFIFVIFYFLSSWRFPFLRGGREKREVTFSFFSGIWQRWKHVALRVESRFKALYTERIFVNILIIAIVFVVLFSPIWINLIKYHKDYFVEEGVFRISPDLLKLVSPAPHSLLNKYIFKLRKYGIEETIFVGFTVLGLAVYSFFLKRKKPDIRFWHIVAIVFVFLSLGPHLVIAGKRLLPLPYPVIHSLPFFSAARNSTRYISLAMLAFGMLAAYSLDSVFSHLRKRGFSKPLQRSAQIFCLLLIAGEYLTVPLRMFNLKPHMIYERMASDGELYSVLEIPFSISGKGKNIGTKKRLGLYQYYQTVHEKNLPSGWLAHLPDKIFDYYEKMNFVPKLCYLQEQREEVPEVLLTSLFEPDIQFKKYLNLYNIRFITIHRGAVKSQGIGYLTRYFKSQLSGDMDYILRQQDKLISFQTVGDLRALFLGENLLLPQHDMMLPEGWSGWTVYQGKAGRWAVHKRATVLFSTPSPRGLSLFLEGEIPEFFLNKSQGIEIGLNSWKVEEFACTGKFSRTIQLPQERILPGSNLISIEFKEVSGIEKGIDEGYRIGRTSIYSPVDIRVVSLSGKYPFRGRTSLGGVKIGPNGRRRFLKSGYNFFVVDEVSGKILSTHNFDTHFSEGSSKEMAGFLSSLEKGKIVIGATWNNASRFLSAEAVEALRSIGAKEDMREEEGFCHVLIGVKGANPGQALERLDGEWAALEVGQFSNSGHVAARFNRLVMSE